MDNKEVAALLDRYFSGDCTPEEKVLVERAYNLQDKDYDQFIADDRFEAMKTEVWNKLDLGTAATKKTYRLWPRIAVAAAAVTAIALCVYFFSYRYYSHSDSSLSSRVSRDLKDIAPGKNGATITLANGKVIQLSGEKNGVVVGEDLKYNDGTTVLSSQGNEGSVNLTAQTAKGQTYQFTLPDGTKVWLNAESKLIFPMQFSGKERKILFSGEGYFEVAKDKAHPFVVTSGKERIEVLGTHFNLNTFGDEHPGTVTSLLEGSVKMTDEIESRVLKPGDRGVSTVKGIMLLLGDARDDVAWKNGEFVFVDNENIERIMRRVQRWYDVEVSYEGDMKDVNFTGSISRSKNISALLKLMERTKQVSFKIEGKKVIATSLTEKRGAGSRQ